MNEDEELGFQSLVSVIAVCGFALLAALTAPLWVGSAQNWLVPLKNWLPNSAVGREGWYSIASGAGGRLDKRGDSDRAHAMRSSVGADNRRCGSVSPDPKWRLRRRRAGPCEAASVDWKRSHSIRLWSSTAPWWSGSIAGLRRACSPRLERRSHRQCRRSSVRHTRAATSITCPMATSANMPLPMQIDLPMFVLADGRKVDVTHGWGSTQRDLIAVAKAKKTAAGVTGSVGQQKKDKSIKGSVSDVVKISAVRPSGTTSANQSAASGVDPKAVAEGKFLRLAHDGGCKVFSTVMGPEANEVHRTHLHLDLQDRKTTVCE